MRFVVNQQQTQTNQQVAAISPHECGALREYRVKADALTYTGYFESSIDAVIDAMSRRPQPSRICVQVLS